MLESYEEFTRHLEDREYFGQKLGLDRIQRLLDRLGNPERRFSAVHIAGTNGKGSTAAMVASILREAGHRVGLYTSPHLEDFCERIRVGGDLISPGKVLHWARAVREVEEEPLTFFELATAIAFLHFAEEKVPLAVIETGLGGRLDATNVVTPRISAITSIGLDHTAHLGETLSEIAFEKGGILKSRVPVVVGPLDPEAMEVIRELADVRGAPLSFATDTELPAGVRLSLAGRHQRENAAVAVAVVERLGLSVDEEAVRRGLQNVVWPGRLEVVSERPWIFLDGAHNPEAMRRLREFFEENLGDRRVKVLFGAMADKDLRGMLSEILPVAGAFVLTAPRLQRAADPQRLGEILSSLGGQGLVIPGVAAALRRILATLRREEVLVVTGSLFVVGEARALFEKRREERAFT